MKNFAAEMESILVQTMLDEGMFNWFRKKQKSPTANTAMKPYRTGKTKDSPHYRTDHHYGHSDIDPETVPIFKPTWQTAGK